MEPNTLDRRPTPSLLFRHHDKPTRACAHEFSHRRSLTVAAQNAGYLNQQQECTVVFMQSHTEPTEGRSATQ